VISVEVKLDGSGLPGTGSIQRMAFHAFWTPNLDVVSVTYETILPGYYWLAGPDHGTVDGNLLYTYQYDQGDWGGHFYDQLIATLVFHVLNEDSPTATIYVGFIEILGDGIWGGLDDGFPNLTPHFISTTDAVIQIAPESSTCGDGVIEDAETCDDGDTAPADGCDASCQVEAGWSCAGEPSVCSFCSDGGIGGT